MTDQQQAQINPEGQQDAPMPSAEQTESGQITETAAQTEVSTQGEDQGLPEGVKDRTREQFEKIQEQLRTERLRREQLEASFRSMQTPKVETAPIYDPETGLLNEQGLTDLQRQTLEANQRAARAEQAVQSYLIEQEEREAFTAHPELQPGKKGFDEELHKVTRSLLYDSMLNPQDYGERQLSFKEAADLAKSLSKGTIEKVKQQAAQETLEQLSPKEQAALQAQGSSSQRVNTGSDLSNLQYKTRKGDQDAMVERLKGVPWANKS